MKPLITISNIVLLVAYSDGESLRTSTEDGLLPNSALANTRTERNGNRLNVNQAYGLDQSNTGNDPRRPPYAGKISRTLSSVVDQNSLCCLNLTMVLCSRGLTQAQKHAAHKNVPKCGGWFKHVGRKRADGSSENRDCQKLMAQLHTPCPGLQMPPFDKTQNRQLSKQEESKHEESKQEESKQEESKHEESKHEESKHEESKQEGHAFRSCCSSENAGMQGNTLCSKLGKPQEEGRPDESVEACLIIMPDIEENALCCTSEGPHEEGRPDESVTACIVTIPCSDEPMQPSDDHPRSHAGSNEIASMPPIRAPPFRFPDDHSHGCSEEFSKCCARCVNGVKCCIRGTYKALRFCLWENIGYPIGGVILCGYVYLFMMLPSLVPMPMMTTPYDDYGFNLR